jgi:STE24 endopeptidase
MELSSLPARARTGPVEIAVDDARPPIALRFLAGIAIAAAAARLIALWLVPADVDDARAFFDEAAIVRGFAVAEAGRVLECATALVQAVLAGLLAWSPAGARASSWIFARSGRRPALAAMMVVAVAVAVRAALWLPADLARWAARRDWGIEVDAFLAFGRDWAGARAAEGLAAAVAAGLLIRTFRRFPRRGALVAGATTATFVVIAAAAWPTLVEPLSNTFTPLDAVAHRDARPGERAAPLRALVERAGGADVYVMDASRQGNDRNAYVSGLFGGGRIVVYDTLLAEGTPAEVTAIVAHELGHRAHHDMEVSVALAVALALAGAWLVRRVLAGTPLRQAGAALLVVGCAVEIVGAPVAAAFSRFKEERADAFALELLGEGTAFIAAQQMLVVDNAADPAPPLAQALLSTHPAPVDRIRMACARYPADCPPPPSTKPASAIAAAETSARGQPADPEVPLRRSPL